MNSNRMDEIGALRAQKKLDREAEVKAHEDKIAAEAKAHEVNMARIATKMARIEAGNNAVTEKPAIAEVVAEEPEVKKPVVEKKKAAVAKPVAEKKKVAVKKPVAEKKKVAVAKPSVRAAVKKAVVKKAVVKKAVVKKAAAEIKGKQRGKSKGRSKGSKNKR
jgi:hypothetical protein